MTRKSKAEAAAAAMDFYIREGQNVTAVEHQTAILSAYGLVVWQDEEEELE